MLSVQEGFISFLLQARACVQSVEPLLAVGATLTSGALLSSPVAPYIQTLLSSADVVPVTYYPLFPDFTVKSPTVVMTDVPAIISALPCEYCCGLCICVMLLTVRPHSLLSCRVSRVWVSIR